MTEPKTCGGCGHFRHHPGHDAPGWGDCKVPLPEWFTVYEELPNNRVGADYPCGADCATFTAREVKP